jgi:hypothetical protein
VLRTAVEEIQRHLNLPEIVISLAAPDETELPDVSVTPDILATSDGLASSDKQSPEVHKQ